MRSRYLSVIAIVMLILAMSPFTIRAESGGGGMGYFMIGYMKMGIDDLNDRFEENGYTAIEAGFLSLGGGGHAVMGRLILGGEGHAIFNGEESNDLYDYSLSAGSGFFNVGYVAYSTPLFRLYPMIGFGGGGVTLKIAESAATPSFDEVLQNPKRSVQMDSGGFLLNVSLGADYTITMEQGKDGAGGFIVGLRAGYVMTPIQDDWFIDSDEISGSPDTGLTGFYIRLLIGGGGYGR
ncbi:MAG: hypothetical protein V2J62_02070 [candidate division KSB1 bacterium]|jgi:hypothetical protein|nr:hypothetical protein [candidate division KSB1 bacterium]